MIRNEENILPLSFKIFLQAKNDDDQQSRSMITPGQNKPLALHLSTTTQAVANMLWSATGKIMRSWEHIYCISLDCVA